MSGLDGFRLVGLHAHIDSGCFVCHQQVRNGQLVLYRGQDQRVIHSRCYAALRRAVDRYGTINR